MINFTVTAGDGRIRRGTATALMAAAILLAPAAAHAYIGPGAGFAFVGSFFVLLATFALAFLTLATWPLRWVIRSMRGRRALSRSRVRRVIVLGLDGQDPELTDKFMKEGILPNFARLTEQGTYCRLDTSLPAESPVAWSCFQTGCNPGRHRVFDFLVPNRKSYLPELCSANVRGAGRTLKLGKYRIPIGSPMIDLGRKSQPFWKILGDHGVFSSILRVPITFPPEKFYGVSLSAMAVPDLKGSQGTFSFYSSDPGDRGKFTGGMQIPVEARDGKVSTYVSGPENTMIEGGGEMRLPFEVRLSKDGKPAELEIDGKRYALPLREYTPWIELNFSAGLGIKVRGMVKFYLIEESPHVKLYMTAVNIDSDKPALPISHPFTYSIYLSKTLGRFSTLGMAEDTWALNERVLDEEAFLKQVWDIHAEREAMFFDAIDKTRRGAVVCVFDITDRLQHMFFRYLDPNHPANPGKDTVRHADAIKDLYRRMDDLLGRTMAAAGEDCVVMVMSDHGFKPFRRGVNLNSWLYKNGYLALKNGITGADYYQDVDWTKTRAFAVGLGGIYLNVKGREAKGVVEPGEGERALRKEIIAKLRRLPDEEKSAVAVAEVYDCKEVYSGPYVKEAPDLFVGFAVGYRASWSCATGEITEAVIEDNTKSWSGDHCMNPPDVPGIFLINRKLDRERVHIMDIGPTILDLFGVDVPETCDGKPFMNGKAA